MDVGRARAVVWKVRTGSAAIHDLRVARGYQRESATVVQRATVPVWRSAMASPYARLNGTFPVCREAGLVSDTDRDLETLDPTNMTEKHDRNPRVGAPDGRRRVWPRRVRVRPAGVAADARGGGRALSDAGATEGARRGRRMPRVPRVDRRLRNVAYELTGSEVLTHEA